ncbi:MAG: hypothetical protein L6Q51_00390 [Cyclobacteriaceae bacterium]|nr:hypothetical protein [Cyclobacteriaceae bacterium]
MGLRLSNPIGHFNLIVSIGFFCCLFYSVCSAQSNNTPNYDSLRVVLEGMLDADQNIRRILIDSIGMQSAEAPKFFRIMEKVDSINQKSIKQILKKYGWIGCSYIGDKAANAIFYIVQHSDLELMIKYHPELKRMASIGEARLAHSALMEDRILMHLGKRQIFGTQIFTSTITGDRFIWPVDNSGLVNKRRFDVGITESVEEFAKRMGARYDPNEPLPKQ